MGKSSKTDWTHAAMLDARGLRCPLPVLKARKALLPLKAGERLFIEATDPMAAVDFPHFCEESGHRLVATEQNGARLSFLIEKG